MNRVSFIVDGFNLYHSVRDAEKKDRKPTKWLNVSELCKSYLHLIGQGVNEKVELNLIYYFSALATHIEKQDPNVTKRHKALLACLKDTGVIVELSRFKRKSVKCSLCQRVFTKYEEKETDVSLAIKLLEIFFLDECDTVVLMTGDTDVAPAVRTAKRLFPQKHIFFAFPYKRKNKELDQIASGSFNIKSPQYGKYQFSDPYRLTDGTLIHKPSSW